MGGIRTMDEFANLSKPEREGFEQILIKNKTEQEFEDMLRALQNRYI